ncbi:hypothetical protein FDUTEX481_02573 [Tolypothrix sp. PCC 7601]|nr:hypothetical protein FDUTEX481_02573 [Tolypothrix sp. PCC 7601]
MGTNQFKIQNSKFKIKELLGMREMRGQGDKGTRGNNKHQMTNDK